jgi:hypothetical protein
MNDDSRLDCSDIPDMIINGLTFIKSNLTKEILSRKNPKPNNRRWVKKFRKKYTIEVADTDHIIFSKLTGHVICHPIVFKRMENYVKSLPASDRPFSSFGLLANTWSKPSPEFKPLTLEKLNRDLEKFPGKFKPGHDLDFSVGYNTGYLFNNDTYT